MTDFDYKKYSLEKIDEWVNDALSTADASPQEIYDTIKKAVEEQYYYFKHHTGRAYELLALLNGNGKGHIQGWKEWEETYYPEEAQKSCTKDDPSPECKKSWTSFWEETDGYEWTPLPKTKKDKVTKWRLPVEVDEVNGEYFVSFPNDLLEAANLKEGDKVEWVDQGDGSYLLKKVEKQMTHDEMLDAGYWMTDDGVWIPPQKS